MESEEAYMKMILILILLLSALLLVGCEQKEKPEYNEVSKETKISNVGSAEADYSIPENSNELISNSEDVVKAKLLKNKTIGQYDEDEMTHTSTISEVEILEAYKGTFKKGDKVNVAEPWYLSNGAYQSVENYIALETGKEYIIFLSDGHGEDKLSAIVSMGYGKFNEKLEEKEATLTDFDTLGEVEEYNFISDEKEDIVNYSEIKDEILESYN